MINLRYAVLCLSLTLGPLSQAQSLHADGSPPQVIELFTSEGCSSCPPADAWLTSLLDRRGLWTDVIPMAFHVDYWDKLGWKDPYAQPDFTDRQRRHAWLGNISQVYTPGFVINGEEWRGYFRGDKAPTQHPDQGVTLDVETASEQLNIRIHSQQNRQARLFVARLGIGGRNHIARGENAGRTLEHDFVVLGWESSALSLNNSAQVQTQIPKIESDDSDFRRYAWVAIVTDERMLPLQGIGDWL